MKKKILFFSIFLFVFLLKGLYVKSNIIQDTIKIKLLPQDTSKVNLLNNIADALKDYDVEKGLEYARQSLDLSVKINYKKGIGEAYKILGVLYYRMGIYDASLDNSLKASDIFIDLNEKTLLSRTFNNIGLVYFARLDYFKAKEYMLKGLKVAKEILNHTEVSRTLHNIGLIEFEKNNLNLSIYYHTQSYYEAIYANNTILIGYNLGSIGRCFVKLNKFDSAKIYFDKCYIEFIKLENPYLIGMLFNQYAEYYLKINQYSKTLEYTLKAFEISKEIGNRYLKLESFDFISKAHEGLKNFEKALEFKTKYYSLSDSLKNEKNIKSIAYIEAKHEYDKKLKDFSLKKEEEIRYTKFILKVVILLSIFMILTIIIIFSFYKTKAKTNKILIQKNEEITKLNEKLNNLNVSKDKFFSIIAHDLRNPFNSILGFSNLIVEEIHEKKFESIEEYANIIQKSSQRTMDLLVNLLDWARLQTGTIGFNAEFIDLVSLINEAIELLNDAALQKSIKIYRNLPVNAPVVVDKSMISTILRNLISNAIKFTNNGGIIEIALKKDFPDFIFSIKDNGIGIKQIDIEKLFKIEESFTYKGTNNEQGTGLGLILCKEFIEKHNGKIWVESESGVGSTFYFLLRNT